MSEWRNYRLIAIAVLVVMLAALALTGCGRDACNGHGGVHLGPVKGWYLCNDHTWQPWSA